MNRSLLRNDISETVYYCVGSNGMMYTLSIRPCLYKTLVSLSSCYPGFLFRDKEFSGPPFILDEILIEANKAILLNEL